MKNLINWIIPKECLGCGKKGSYLCKECQKTINIHSEICPICNRLNKGFEICDTCNKEGYPEKIIIGFYYEKYIKKLILGLKFYNLFDYKNYLGEKIKLLFNIYDVKNNKNTILTFVPSHWTRKYFIKGYNQSELLTKQISKITNIGYKKICKKYKITKTQTGLNRKKRKSNLKNSFQLCTKLEGNETIIIVDDVTTTGSTIIEISKTIKKIYPNIKTIGFVLAKNTK